MKFRHLKASLFGPLNGLEVAIPDGLVLLFGRNESGKSTFRDALETLLYGFDPATRDTHPLVDHRPESPSDLHLEAELVLDGGETLRVERILQATGKTRTASDGEPFSGRRKGNRPLPLVDGLPRLVFRSLYSIELSELAALDHGVKAHVDDLLLPAAAQLDLRPAREVREELGREHRTLWRSDNRGKPKIQALRDTLAAARRQVSEATHRERQLRENREEQARLSAEIDERRDLRRRLERDAADAPLLAQMADLMHRRSRLGDPVDLALLEDDPLADPSALATEIEQLDESLERPRARIAEEPLGLAADERAVLDRAPDIEGALEQSTEHEIQRRRASEQSEGADLLRAASRRELGGLLGEESAEDAVELVRLVAIEALRAAQVRWSEAFEDFASAPPPPAPSLPAWSLTLFIAGLAFAVISALLPLESWLTLLGVGGAGGALLMGQLAKTRTPAEPPPAPERPAGVETALGDLRLPEDLLATPTALQRAIEILSRTKAASEDSLAAAEESQVLAAQVAERDRRWRELCASVGLEATQGDVPLARLQNALELARQAEASMEKDAAEREQARELVNQLAPPLARKRASLDRIARTLRRAEPDIADLSDAYARVQQRLDEARFLRRREEEVAGDPRHGELSGHPALSGEVVPPPWDPGEVARRNIQIAELTEGIESTNVRLGQLARTLDTDDGRPQARAHDEVRELEDAVVRVERRRDRLALLESIVARAEREYRDAHQPDVLRRAGNHLRRITGGRYTRLDYLSDDEGGLQVYGAEHEEPVPVAYPISRGTLDQIFLCLRLGLLDHLDAGREKLPLVLDDALLRMDDERREAGVRVLGDLAATRQIFLLTCHNAVASEVERALGVARIALGETGRAVDPGAAIP